MSDMRGMILGAGYGTRLAPVTDHVPKPLLQVDGVPLLDRIIAGFDRCGVEKIGINTHHLGSMVSDHVIRRSDAARFTLFPEDEILGTGGALDGAREFLGDTGHFLLHNGDVLCDADLDLLAADHSNSGALATLLLVDWPEVNSVTLAADGSIISIAGIPRSETGGQALTYAGIGVFSSRLLDDIGPGFSSLIDPLRRAIESSPGSVRGFVPENYRWSDLGTLARYLDAQSASPEEEASGTPSSGLHLDRITGHGSDRRFWRLGAGDWSAVAMVSPDEDEEFGRFISIAGFLHKHDLGAPEVLSVSEPDRTVLMSDLGADSLYSLVRENGFDSGMVADSYRRTVDRLVEIQAATKLAEAECLEAVDRRLGYEALRWETGYFRDRFLVGHLGLDPANLGLLEEEFHALAESVASQPRVLMHRDFQSQNILVAGSNIGLVDFQGMRLGPLGYDLASLVFDPYVAMPLPYREELLARFQAVNPAGETLEEIRAMTLAAGLQRVMQALGAYGFLGHVKGKADFLDHIPTGMTLLQEILAEMGEGGSGQNGTDGRWIPAPMKNLENLLATGNPPG